MVDQSLKDLVVTRLLPRVKTPGQYIGGELNAVVKDHARVRGKLCLAFPDTYAIVTVKTKDGRELVERCNKPRGLWGVPLTRDERLTKFRDCVEPAMPKQAAEEIIELVEGMDDLKDVHSIMERVALAK